VSLAVVSTAEIAMICVAVLAWLGFAFYTGGIGRNNGQSYHVWLLIGFLTGPVGLLFAFVYFRMAGERGVRHRYGDDDGVDVLPTMIRCPSCGETVPSRFETCQFCQAKISHLRGRRPHFRGRG